MKFPDLPITPSLGKIREILSSNSSLVLTASPGAGKTTLIPLALLEAPWTQGKKIVMLEPRRIATKAAAHRMASILESRVGDVVGYQIRFEKRSGPQTRLEILTEGLLMRRLQSDPYLEDTACVIFDEFHERNLHSEIGLAQIKELQQTVREDIKIVVMSATFDPVPVSRYLCNCPIFEVSSPPHPLEIMWFPSPAFSEIPEEIAKTILNIVVHDKSDGDILAFLPGEGEIFRTISLLSNRPETAGFLILPLFGSLPLERQEEAMSRQSRRKIVVATNVAETSVTIEGVNKVVDSGWCRRMYFDRNTGLEKLENKRISRASADQRSGRAARTGPGVTYRLWSPLEHAEMEAETPPEITRSDLSGCLLELAVWGKPDPEKIDWLLSPPPDSIKNAIELLNLLGAIDKSGKPTVLGELMAGLPLSPRLAAMLLYGKSAGLENDCAEIVAQLSERDIFQRTQESVFPPANVTNSSSDVLVRLDALHNFQDYDFIDRRALENVKKIAEQLIEIVKKCNFDRNRTSLSHPQNEKSFQQKAPGTSAAKFDQNAIKLDKNPANFVKSASELQKEFSGSKSNSKKLSSPDWQTGLLKSILAAYPDRVAKRRKPLSERDSKSSSFLMVGGRGFKLHNQSSVRDAELIVAVSADSGQDREGTIRMASRIEKNWLIELFPQLVCTSRGFVWDAEKEMVCAKTTIRFLDLPISESPSDIKPDESEKVSELVAQEARKDLYKSISWNDDAFQIIKRIELARSCPMGKNIPLIDEKWLSENLSHFAFNCRSFAELREKSIKRFIENSLEYRQIETLNSLVPEKMTVPSGSNIRIQYPRDNSPFLAVRIQEIFGWTSTPTILGGRLPLVIHLLSPASRPLQITQDLTGFFKNVYQTIKKEMRANYPRHYWPEDPFTAVAQRGPKKRGS
ncbi:MAG: DEAD/DEAH box helicase [Candidatus Riflebacteria bacterium]|nr:DEAD/DEAH box helicase [Candidatus Riflebacteria bacterium]